MQAVEAASRAGIVVVVSAGNYGTNPTTGLVGYAGITSPGNAPSAITVGAVSAQDTVARGDDRDRQLQLARADVVRRARPSRTSSRPAPSWSSNAAKNGTLYANYPGAASSAATTSS